MNKLKLTTRLNIKVVCVVCIFMLVVILHNQWVSLNERKAQYSKDLIDITEFISKKIDDRTFAEIAVIQGSRAESEQDKALLINQKMQPILDDVFISADNIKFGVYLRQTGRIVAIGPTLDGSLLIPMDSKAIQDTYSSDTTLLTEKERSITWYGAKIMYHLRPIKVHGEIVGHVFACVNLDKTYQGAWRKTLNMLFIALIGLIIVIIFFQDIFIRLKKDLELFAREIVKGDAKNFASELPELTPVLQYINEQTEKMMRLDRLNIIGEMAASIGHEVRNPMTTVRGFLQYIGGKEKFAQYKAHFDLMIEEMDRANGIITEFLSLAKNKSMDFQESNLNDLIREIQPLIMADALRNNCQVEVNCGSIKTVLLDKNSMRQLLLNVVRNAIEAMPEGGIITISTETFQDKALLMIRDEGIGIPADVLDKLGTPFFTTKEKGTGLGLAVCYRIVERHNANLSIESTEGTGTTFKILFNYV
ncbi:MAG: two-component sensor histidine kinase [Pelosinus sp.]|nr:two-component sensor histidine kinase [Pelosinus sp.]